MWGYPADPPLAKACYPLGKPLESYPLREPLEKAAYEALCYHASGAPLGMPERWNHCEGMFGCRWGCQCRDPDGKRELRRLAKLVPAGTTDLRKWAKEQLQKEWRVEYRKMQRNVLEWQERYPEEARRLMPTTVPAERAHAADEARIEAMVMMAKVDAAYEALEYHASGKALVESIGGSRWPRKWSHCEGMFGCRWGCNPHGRTELYALAHDVPDDREGDVRAWAKEQLQARWGEEYGRLDVTRHAVLVRAPWELSHRVDRAVEVFVVIIGIRTRLAGDSAAHFGRQVVCRRAVVA